MTSATADMVLLASTTKVADPCRAPYNFNLAERRVARQGRAGDARRAKLAWRDVLHQRIDHDMAVFHTLVQGLLYRVCVTHNQGLA